MGRRPGSTTKSGRFMNPADQERKSMRQKELKRNKRQRTMVRQAILKSKDVDEIIESLKRLDEQEFDVHVEHHSKYVFNEKRAKLRQTFNEVMNLHKQEKRDDKIKELIEKMEQYEIERTRKIQLYNAQRFSLEANPNEIPLPDGVSVPNAAMTPVAPSIPAQYLMPQARAGILKHTNGGGGGGTTHDNDNTSATAFVEHGEPPGPPVGLPPTLKFDDTDAEVLPPPPKRKVRFGESETKLIHDEFEHNAVDDDYGPVDIPNEVMDQDRAREMSNANISIAPPLPNAQQQQQQQQQQPLVRAPPLPPNMLPPPPRLPIRMPPPPPNFPRPGFPSVAPSASTAAAAAAALYGRMNASDSVISAAPVVRRPTETNAETSTTTSTATGGGSGSANGGGGSGAEATISAEPKLRDLTKEVTAFVPIALRTANRHKIQPKKQLKKFSVMGVQVESAQRKEAKDTDEAYAEFMKEVSSLL